MPPLESLYYFVVRLGRSKDRISSRWKDRGALDKNAVLELKHFEHRLSVGGQRFFCASRRVCRGLAAQQPSAFVR